MENPQAYLGRLKAIHIFKGLQDDQILEVAKQLVLETRRAGETIFEEGEEGQHFYIINRGQVKVLRKSHGGQPQFVSLLVAGDYFGETSLMYGRRRSATIEADTDVELLLLSKEDFENLLRQYPHIKPNLLASTESRRLYRRLDLKWVGPAEVVYLIARRHQILLYQSLLLPIGLLALLLVGVGLIAWYITWQWAVGVLILGGLPLAGWILWNTIDWSNDYYIVTNKRVVYLEKIVGIYDSRQEAPLGSVMSVNVQTTGALERAFGVGDIVVRTFSGPITMQAVANPHALAALIEEHWYRTRTREKEAEQEALRQAVRRRIIKDEQKLPDPPKPSLPVTTVKKVTPLGKRLAQFFSFRVRFEQGESVVYRKHWFILLQRIWQPSLLILLALGLVAAKLLGFIPEQITLSVVLLIALVGLIPLGGWWLYEFVDWRNDIYQVTPDQILDVVKKPLGPETRKSAPLGNVLSLKYERPGLLGLLLNYGTVVANVAGQDFRFEGVFDPVGVQNDVYRRIEAMNAKRTQTEANKRREELADWVGVYHNVMTELNEDLKKQKQKPGYPK
jgi:CRP-like cAMP-binding protein